MEKLSILSLNIDRHHERLTGLLDMMKANRTLAVLIQDLPIIDKLTINTMLGKYGPDYCVANNIESPFTESHDTMIILNKRHVTEWNEIETGSISKEHISSKGITITTKDIPSQRLNIFNIYIRPRTPQTTLKRFLEDLENKAKTGAGMSRTIIGGDVNASDNSWDPDATKCLDPANEESTQYKQIKINRGRLIAKKLRQMKITVVNQPKSGPTFETGPIKSYIDIIAMGTKALRKWSIFKIAELKPKQDGHKIIIIQTREPKNSMPAKKKIYQLKRIKPEHFIALNEINCRLATGWNELNQQQTIQRMNEMSNNLNQTILEIQHLIQREIWTITTERSNGTIEPNIRKLINKIRKLHARREQLLHNVKSTTTPHLYAVRRQRTNRITNRIERLKNKLINSQINASSVQNQDTLWNRAKDAVQTNSATENLEQTKLLENDEEIERIASEKFPKIYRINETDSFEMPMGEAHCTLVSETEIENAINEIKNKKHTGADNVNFRTFNEAIKYAKPTIINICKMSFKTAHIPECCKTNLGKIIPKKKPGQYRIVHIATPLSGLLEQIALHRTEYRLEENNLYSQQQYGFMPRRSRHDLIARLTKFIHTNRGIGNIKPKTTIVALDIEGAFDNVNQDDIIDQIMEELAPDPIRYWIRNFILNRQIIVSGSRHTRAQSRQVCKGVPQGSSLGPILWNLTINKLDNNIRHERKLEILTYADDIIIASNWKDKNKTQDGINKVVEKLERIKLVVKAEKSQTMTIYPRTERDYTKQEFYIKGQTIPTANSIEILGIPITNKLKLDTKSTKLTNRINEQVGKLIKINQTGIINQHTEWKILLNNLLFSVTIHNNLPILAIDQKGLKWCDRIHNLALKKIFEWPNNISEKLIRLITGTIKSETTIRHMIRKRTEPSNAEYYEHLYAEMIEPKEIPNQDQSHQVETLDHSRNHSQTYRRFANPTLLLGNTIRRDASEVGKNEPTWILIETDRASCITQFFNNEIIQTRIGRHQTYRTGYFNTIALLWNNIENIESNSRKMSIKESSSILKAMTNTSNHDWRVIELREKLIRNGWQIVIHEGTANQATTRQLTRELKQVLKRNNNLAQRNHRDTQENSTAETNALNIAEYTIPDAADYRIRNIRQRAHTIETSIETSNNHTQITKFLNERTEYWQDKSSPNHFSSATMLMLTGMISNKTTGKLETGVIRDNMTPSGCETNVCGGTIRRGTTCSLILDLTMNTRRTNNTQAGDNNIRHVTLHRGLECPRYEEKRTEIEHMIQLTAHTIPDEMDELTNLQNGQEESGGQHRRNPNRRSIAQKTAQAVWEDRVKKAQILKFLTDCAFDT